jgi:hypothetical protein
MSLHVLANHMSTKGRNGDSMLVHMTPNEVQGLQALAMKHGGSLTINPDTGLPEANFLKKLLPMIAGFALGPAGMGIAFGGLSSAASAGLLVGGVTGLATGSLSKGLMAGLGAYGGAGLGAGLETAAVQGELASSMPTLAGQAPEQIKAYSDQVIAARDAAMSKVGGMGGIDKLSAGFDAVKTAPGAFLKDNMMPLAAAASPIMADMMVPTATKAPTNTNPAYIRQYVAGDRPQAPRALAPVLASEWGSRNFSDAYATPMAGGGIVALADGGLSAGAQYAAANNVDVGANVNKFIQDNPFATAADINTALTKAGMTQADVNPFLTANTNISDATRYALSHAGEMPGAGGLAGMQAGILKGLATPNLTQAQIDAEQKKYGISDADIQAPFAHGYQVDPNQTAAAQQYLAANKDVAAYLSSEEGRDYLKQHPEFDASDIAYTHYMRYGKNEGRQFGTPSVVPGDVRLDTATTYDNGSFGNYGSGNKTGVDYQGNTVSIATPGDILTNPDNSRTVTPNAPGRPYGGFTGIENLKSAYTAGGGSLGYTPYIPTTPEEHDKLYNTQGSDSLAAYNYLIGKGAGTPGAARYPTRSVATEIAKPYEEAVLGYPTDITKKKYINVGGKMVLNPNYVAPKTQSEKTATAATAAKAGKPSTISVVDSSGYNTETITATLQDNGTYLGNNNKRYDASGKELAAMGGMMGYAVGGGLGSLGSYSDGGRLLKGPGDGVSDSIPATIGQKQQPARLADGEFVVPARIVSELGNGSTEAGARKLYAMMDRVQKARGKTTGKNKVAANSRADKYLPA